MSQTNAAVAGRKTLPIKPAKIDEAEAQSLGKAVAKEPPVQAAANAPAKTPPKLTSMPSLPPAKPTITWSDEDEAVLSALMARRKAAGYQRRGRDVSAQMLGKGQIKPNPDTVAATIVGLIGSRDSITRAELLDLMAAATFPHPKAQPKDKGWCQGYVAGLIRGGFLTVIEDAPAAARAA